MPIFAFPETLKPVPILTLPLTPKPPTIVKAPVVEDVEFVLDKTPIVPLNVAFAKNVFAPPIF